MNLKAVQRLSDLCIKSNERKNSDSVFIAALAALKQILISCEKLNINIGLKNEIREILLNDKLSRSSPTFANNSNIVYSSNEESFV
jgi:hypothetical protein